MLRSLLLCSLLLLAAGPLLAADPSPPAPLPQGERGVNVAAEPPAPLQKAQKEGGDAAAATTEFLALLLKNGGVRSPLFSGDDTRGLVVTGCTVEVDDGVLQAVDGDGFIRSEHKYKDFILEVSYHSLRTEKYDAGIYIRCDAPAKNQKWPGKHQINLKQGDEGNLIGFPKGRSTGLVKPGEWNTLRLTVVGKLARMEINGKPAWEVDNLEPATGYVGIQVEVPGGGEFEYKDLYVTELGYRPLFDGKTLAGWEGGDGDAEKCWKVEEGLLHCTGEKGPWLRSKEEVGDYNLRLDYKLSPGGNSGVFSRVPADGNHHGKNSGLEIQVLDDAAKQYEKLKDYQFSASVYDIVGADPRVSRPAGEWNSLEINASGPNYRIVHNGVTVVEATDAKFPELKERLLKGFLGLQNHSTKVWFRNLRLGPAME